MPKTEDLALFAHQLANWTEQMIENGRTPFRRVDLFFSLQTEQGPCEPPLILWINRRSLIAGGLIFLPAEKKRNPDYSAEAAATEALGLRHFVCWEQEHVRIFETGARGNRVVATHALGRQDDPFFFQHLLYEILEQLKLFSVTGRIDPASLSPYYLVNLFNETLRRSEPALLEHCRTMEAPRYEIRSCEQIAGDWNRLALLRLLSLLYWQTTEENLSIDNLQAGCQEQLSQLPEPLASLMRNLYPLATHDMPQEATVAFHHLLLRLKQLAWQPGSLRSQTVMRTLLALWYEPEPGANSCDNHDRRLIHAPWLAPECCHETSSSAALLASNAIVRTLNKGTHPRQQWGDSFCFHAPFVDHKIEAFFVETSRPATALRRALAGHLRTSWPNRHLNLAGHLPYWVFEAAHVLGLCPENTITTLELPSKWLFLLENSFFCELLFGHFVITNLWVLQHNAHRLILERRSHQVLTRCHLADGTERQIELNSAALAATRELFYTLELPTELYELYRHQQLRILTEPLAHEIAPAALALYARTSLGQYLQKIRAMKPPSETDNDCAGAGILAGWLVPEPNLAHELHPQAASESTIAETDRQLAKIMGLAPHFSLNLPQLDPPDLVQTVAKSRVERNLPQELIRQLEIEGIPSFPKTYLYRYATGSLKLYRFAPPLQVVEELLGEYELVDAKGQTLNVSGEETQEALLLASSLGLNEIEIPEDRQQTAAILENYRADLQSLKDRVEHLCYSHTGQAAAAQRLSKKIWQQLPLPPRKQLSD